MPEGMDWIIILVVLVVCFGGAQIPKLARSLGQAQKEFKQGLKDGADDEPSTPSEPAAGASSEIPSAAPSETPSSAPTDAAT